MGALVDALHRLHRIESDLNTFRAKEESIRRKVRNAEHQIAKNATDHQAHLQEVSRCQMDIDNADLDIKSREADMVKHRQALNAAKTNKEYAAILTALNTEKADTAKCESRILELMGRKDELLARSREFEAEEARLRERQGRYEQELADYLAAHKQDYERLEKERREAAEALPPSALDAFNRVAERHEGDAMAEAIRVSVRGEDHVCGGCNMAIPLEQVNRLKSTDDLVTCGCCGRILYAAD